MTRIAQGLLWVARRCAEAIRWVARELEKLAGRVEHGAASAVELAQEAVDCVRKSEVGRTIIAGYEKLETFVKASEFFSAINRMTSWLAAFLLGQTCSIVKAASWSSFITCAATYSITFIAMVAGSMFVLYLIGQLTQLRL